VSGFTGRLAAVGVAALAARLILLLLRGDYLVYDEGYYLLLARSLGSEEGFRLNGLPHVALSPLQPALVVLLSALGAPEVWASRLLAAAAGACLVFPVGALGALIGGPAAGLAAAVVVAGAPPLMTFVPFFPGETWNLYFGAEPLFLLATFGAALAAARLDATGRWTWGVAAGSLGAAAYLSRGEGVIVAGALTLVLTARLALRRAGTAPWRGLVLAVVAGGVVSAPYLWHLRRTLGRWALSGRVQAMVAARPDAPGRSLAETTRRGGAVLEEFVWGGNPERFLREHYGLSRDGTRMASQYWGVAGRPVATRPAGLPPAPVLRDTVPDSPPGSRLRTAGRALGAVMPAWLGLVGLAGIVVLLGRGGAQADSPGARPAAIWLLPPLAAAIVPAAVTYPEPRALLPLVPIAALGAGWLWAQSLPELRNRTRHGRRWATALATALLIMLAFPAARDGLRAARGDTPLQQVASAQRAVGTYLRERLPENAIVMSWHPAVGVWAERDWRVLPYESFERIVRYAQAQRVGAIVFSRFHPSPLRDPPRAFTVVLLDSTSVAPGPEVRLDPVDETPLMLVGRLATDSLGAGAVR
jgi:hypothetical protein